MFFANAELFHDRVLDAVAASPTPVRWLVVAAEPVTSVDVTSADMLAELDETLHAAGIELCFAEMKDPVKDKLKRFGLFARLGEDDVLSDHRCGRQQLSQDPSGGLGGLGGPGSLSGEAILGRQHPSVSAIAAQEVALQDESNPLITLIGADRPTVDRQRWCQFSAKRPYWQPARDAAFA